MWIAAKHDGGVPQWYHGRTLSWSEDLQNHVSSMVVAEHVSRYHQLHQWLCPMCYCHWLREKTAAPNATYSCRPSFPGIDIMELPLTANGNKYAIVFQDLFTKWPMVYATPDQKAERIAKLLAQEIVPMFGVPEALLSDRGTNLLSCLCRMCASCLE